jgi:hypothetical protein
VRKLPSTWPRRRARLALLPPTRPGPKSASSSAHLPVALGLSTSSGSSVAATPLLPAAPIDADLAAASPQKGG